MSSNRMNRAVFVVLSICVYTSFSACESSDKAETPEQKSAGAKASIQLVGLSREELAKNTSIRGLYSGYSLRRSGLSFEVIEIDGSSFDATFSCESGQTEKLHKDVLRQLKQHVP